MSFVQIPLLERITQNISPERLSNRRISGPVDFTFMLAKILILGVALFAKTSLAFLPIQKFTCLGAKLLFVGGKM